MYLSADKKTEIFGKHEDVFPVIAVQVVIPSAAVQQVIAIAAFKPRV